MFRLLVRLIPAVAVVLTLCVLTAADTECPVVTTQEDRRVDKSVLRLVSYNVEWLFMEYYKGADCPGDGCPWWNETAAGVHLSHVSGILNELKPDIINLVEIEGCDEVKMLRRTLDEAKLFRSYLKKGTDTATGQNVGLLTKVDPAVSLWRTDGRENYPVPGSQCGYEYFDDTGISKHYITEFNIGDTPVALVSLHLKAFPTTPSACAQREAQTQVAQVVLADFASRGYELVVVGDLNDWDAQVPDSNGNVPNSMALDILKGLKGSHAGEYLLHNVAESLPQAQRFSEWYDSDNDCSTSSASDYSMIDHVLVSPGLMDRVANVTIYNWAYNGSCATYNSDHYPVVVDFKTV